MARREADPWMIVPARHQHAHVHSVARRSGERLDLRSTRHEVRACDPDRPLGRYGLDLQRTRDSEPPRLAFDDANERGRIHARIQVRRSRGACEVSMRAATLLSSRSAPHAIERLNHIAGGCAFDQYGRVTPRCPTPLENTRLPLATN